MKWSRWGDENAAQLHTPPGEPGDARRHENLPHPCRAFVACRDDEPVVRAEHRSPHGPLVAAHYSQTAPRAHVPHLRRVVAIRGGQELAIPAYRRAGNAGSEV